MDLSDLIIQFTTSFAYGIVKYDIRWRLTNLNMDVAREHFFMIY